MAHYNAEQAQELRERLNEKWEDQTLFELRNAVLNDQGGGFMEVTHGMTETLRTQEHGHPPITFDKIEGAKNR